METLHALLKKTECHNKLAHELHSFLWTLSEPVVPSIRSWSSIYFNWFSLQDYTKPPQFCKSYIYNKTQRSAIHGNVLLPHSALCSRKNHQGSKRSPRSVERCVQWCMRTHSRTYWSNCRCEEHSWCTNLMNIHLFIYIFKARVLLYLLEQLLSIPTLQINSI